MPQPLDKLLAAIEKKKIPPVILVGGNNDYLVEDAFQTIRDRILSVAPGVKPENFPETADLSLVLDSFRTYSLFGGLRLLILPEVNAFVTKKEVQSLYEKAVSDWSGAKTDRKRASAIAKLLHLLGLLGCDVETPETSIADYLGLKKIDAALGDMLNFARSSGKKASRGEGDAALLLEAISQGGSPGATLLMRTGEIPKDSASINVFDRVGAVVVCDLTREEVPNAITTAIREIAEESGVTFDAAAVTALRNRLGIDRILADKFSRDVPDIRLAITEAQRLATYAGAGGRVTAKLVEEQIGAVGGGARYEFGSLFSERKPMEAVAKLRDLVAQARREDAKTPSDVVYGRFLFALADELRQMLGIISFARLRKIDLSRSMNYNSFKDRMADTLSDFLKENRLVRQKPHPFALFKKLEAARTFRESELVDALSEVAELEFRRKSGGISPEIGLESLVLTAAPRR